MKTQRTMIFLSLLLSAGMGFAKGSTKEAQKSLSTTTIVPESQLSVSESQALGDAAWRVVYHAEKAREILNKEGLSGKTAIQGQLDKAHQLLTMIDRALPMMKSESKITLGGQTYKDSERFKPNLVPIYENFAVFDVFSNQKLKNKKQKGKEKFAEADDIATAAFLNRTFAAHEVAGAQKALTEGKINELRRNLESLSHSVIETVDDMILKPVAHNTNTKTRKS